MSSLIENRTGEFPAANADAPYRPDELQQDGWLDRFTPFGDAEVLCQALIGQSDGNVLYLMSK